MAGILKVDQYQDFNGNTIMTSDGSGNITLSDNITTINSAALKNTPAFHATVNASNSTTDNTETKVSFATEVIDTDNAYDTSTSKFTVPSGKAGKYFIYSRIRVNSATDSEIYDILVKKNGSSVFQHSANQYRYTSAYVSGILDLAASDYIEIYVLISGGLSLRNETTTMFFGGYRLIGA
jgi:hypothetical protein